MPPWTGSMPCHARGTGVGPTTTALGEAPVLLYLSLAV